jgi:hypothetical protein
MQKLILDIKVCCLFFLKIFLQFLELYFLYLRVNQLVFVFACSVRKFTLFQIMSELSKSYDFNNPVFLLTNLKYYLYGHSKST